MTRDDLEMVRKALADCLRHARESLRLTNSGAPRVSIRCEIHDVLSGLDAALSRLEAQPEIPESAGEHPTPPVAFQDLWSQILRCFQDTQPSVGDAYRLKMLLAEHEKEQKG